MRKFYLLTIIVFIAALCSAYALIPKYRGFEFDYNFTIKDIPSTASDIKVWIPYPSTTSYQAVHNIATDITKLFSISYDKKYKNKILYCTADTIEDLPMNFEIRYRVRREEYFHKPIVDSSELERYLKPNKLVTVSPRIKALADSICQDKHTTMDKARAIYDYVLENMAYDKTIPGWGRGDTERACDVWAGNCTDFHSLFISLCRATGIPAKFLMGVKLPKDNKGKISSYHCWAEFYAEGFGWVPVDISEAWKDISKKEYYFGAICEDRIEFTYGRDIILEPNQNGEPLNYFIYPYVEIDGEIFRNVEVSFEFRNI